MVLLEPSAILHQTLSKQGDKNHILCGTNGVSGSRNFVSPHSNYICPLLEVRFAYILTWGMVVPRRVVADWLMGWRNVELSYAFDFVS